MQQLVARRLAAGIAAACSLFLLAACASSTAGHGQPADQPGTIQGGGSTPTGGGSPSTSSGSPGSGGGADSGSPRQINKSVYYGGFRVQVQTASMTKDKITDGPAVHLDIIFTNQGDNEARFWSTDASLSSHGNNFDAGFDTNDQPNVPGNASGHGAFDFTVDANFSFNDAMLTLGKSDKQQAKLPLGDGGTLVAHEPQAVKLTGATTSDQIRAQLVSGEIRPDLPRRHDESRAGRTSFKVVVNVTAVHTGAGGYALGPTNFALTLPDGTRVATSDQDNLIQVIDDKETVQGVTMWFDIPAPAKGRYLFMLTDNFRAGGAKPITTAIAINLNAAN